MEEQERSKQYDYKTNSNLVLERDRRGIRRSNEPTGEVESLRDRMGGTRMGDRVKQSKPSLPTKPSKGPDTTTAPVSITTGGYTPRTKETAEAYGSLLSFVQHRLGDQSAEVLRDAAVELLALVKDKESPPQQQLKEVRLLLGGLSELQFNSLLEITAKITDFTAVEAEEEEELEAGVAVVFDESEEEQELEMEVRDEEEEEEKDESGVLANTSAVEQKEQQTETMAAEEIEAYWLQGRLKEFYKDANESQRMATETLAVLGEQEARLAENKLVMLLGFDKFALIKQLLLNKDKIHFCTRLKQAQSDEDRAAIEEEMRSRGLESILLELAHKSGASSWEKDRMGEFNRRAQDEARALKQKDHGSRKQGVTELSFDENIGQGLGQAQMPMKELDLDEFEFDQGDHLNSNKKLVLPPGTWEKKLKGYEEVHVPPLKPKPFDKDEKLIPIKNLPKWAQHAFVIRGKKMESLNRIQSKIYSTALWQDKGDEIAPNLLVCAPTGAGKTNVAMLTILHEIGKFVVNNEVQRQRLTQQLKIIYVAPMKALVQEVVGNFTSRLTEAYGVKVRELSGDQSLSKAEIADTQIIVTTPEKWDIITRKSGERAYTQLVKLVIIDEIHLLHNDRGAVLEGIVARTLRQQEQTQEPIRIVGISATLPNFQDVAKFLRVKPNVGLFFFDNSFRPVPLQQQYIGITEKKALKRMQTMNEVCYNKVSSSLKNNRKDQVLVFVHTRNETQKTATAISTMALEKSEVDLFVNEDALEAKEVLQSEAETSAKHPALKELLPSGIGIHHAGMTRSDRNLVEDLFTQGYIKVLVSTATLAWGVNLPAHTVIIKGTQVYSPEKGRWIELSQLDILQMLGRAGRPQFDTEGQGVIITTHSELRYYLSLLNEQLPIESQLVKKLPDMLNAEIVMGSIQNVKDAAVWMGYTYLYVRMRQNPSLYGISVDDVAADPLLEQRRVDMIHSAAIMLDKAQLIRYDRRTGGFQVTPLGKIASHYYVAFDSMATYNEHLRPTMGDIEIFRVFSLSREFKNIIVRSEEKMELAKLVERAPIPVKESIEEPTAKVNVLLQAYISKMRLDGYAIACDLVYVHQSAGRLVRALFEICLSHGWASLALRCLDLANMVEHQVWSCHHFLRQLLQTRDGKPLSPPFDLITPKTVTNLERNHLTPEQYFVLSPQELGELSASGGIKFGRALHRLVHAFPRLELKARYQPITPTTLSIELVITPNFEFLDALIGRSQVFWVLVEDCDGAQLLHYEQFSLKASMVNVSQSEEDDVNVAEIVKVFTVPITRDPLPPQYYVKVVSDRYLHCQTSTAIPFRGLILPHKYPAPTELLDLLPQPIATLDLPDNLKQLLSVHTQVLNAIQTQTQSMLLQSQENVLVAAPDGSGKEVCMDLAIVREMLSNKDVRVVYIAPFDSLCQQRLLRWQKSFGKVLSIAKLSGDTASDLKLLSSNIVLSTPEQWDLLSRRWKQRKSIQQVDLYLIDQLHMIGAKDGAVLEVVVSRIRYMTAQIEKNPRVVGCSSSLANADDIGAWIGCSTAKSKQSLFNFHPSVRPVPLEVFVRGFSEHHFGTRMLEMSKLLFATITRHAPQQQTLVFVPSRRQTQLSAIDLLTFASAAGQTELFKPEGAKLKELESVVDRVTDESLRVTLTSGIGFVHDGMRASDRALVDACYAAGVIRVLFQPVSMCWGVAHSCALSIVMGTTRFDGGGYADYSIVEIMHMMGKATVGPTAKCVVFCHDKKKEYYKKFLFTPLPVESQLDMALADHLCAEVVTKTIKDKQNAVDYMTWTFYYRRISKNPNYYGLKGVSDYHLNDHLSELVEEKLADLEESNCIAVENEMNLFPLNLGIIASYYYIHYSTVDFFASCLKDKSKFKTILEVLSSAAEFEQVPVRYGEERVLREMFKRVKLPVSFANFTSARTKANILLQSHFSRTPLSTDMRHDQKLLVLDSIRLLRAMIDIISSNGWLKPALVAMEMSQMVVQARWKTDSPLLQLPHFTEETVERCVGSGVKSVFDVMDMEDDQRDKVLQLSESQMADVADFCNAFPDIDVSFTVENADDLSTGDQVTMHVKVERAEEEEEYGKVVSKFYPKPKIESWWLVLGDNNSNSLLSIKRFTFAKETSLKLTFEAPSVAGKHELKLYCMCDSVIGSDQEYSVPVQLKQGEEQSDSD